MTPLGLPRRALAAKSTKLLAVGLVRLRGLLLILMRRGCLIEVDLEIVEVVIIRHRVFSWFANKSPLRILAGTLMIIVFLTVGLNPNAAIGWVCGRPFAREPIEVNCAAIFMEMRGAVLEDVVPGPCSLWILVKVT